MKKLKNLKVFKYKAEDKFPFKKKNFDLVISINTLHNLKLFDLENSIKEIWKNSKISKFRSMHLNNERKNINHCDRCEISFEWPKLQL